MARATRTRVKTPSFERALEALKRGDHTAAAARFGARALADPKDWISRVNRGVALWHAGRWSDAVPIFLAEIHRAGWEDPGTVAVCFSLGDCLLHLGRHTRSLLATTLFLDLGNAEHPLFAEGVGNTAAAWEGLRQVRAADALRSRPWTREEIIRASYRILGLPASPRPPRRMKWLDDEP